jgi:hypothetical protein
LNNPEICPTKLLRKTAYFRHFAFNQIHGKSFDRTRQLVGNTFSECLQTDIADTCSNNSAHHGNLMSK